VFSVEFLFVIVDVDVEDEGVYGVVFLVIGLVGDLMLLWLVCMCVIGIICCDVNGVVLNCYFFIDMLDCVDLDVLGSLCFRCWRSCLLLVIGLKEKV